MPRLKRWWPKAQDFNEDDEGWEMTDRFGDRAVRVWDEMCAIFDRTENHWRVTEAGLKLIARKCRMSSSTVNALFIWAVDKLWIGCEERVYVDLKKARKTPAEPLANGWRMVAEYSANLSAVVVSARNYWKYHPKAEPQKIFEVPLLPSFLIKKEKKKRGSSGRASPVLFNKKSSDPIWIPVVLKILAIDRARFRRLDEFVRWAQSEKYSDAVIALGLERFHDCTRKELIIGDWWGYARVLMQKAAVDIHQQQHEQRKREEQEFFTADLPLIAPRDTDA
jgi:hypothetical protein